MVLSPPESAGALGLVVSSPEQATSAAHPDAKAIVVKSVLFGIVVLVSFSRQARAEWCEVPARAPGLRGQVVRGTRCPR